MWTRMELKMRAKVAFRRNYWACVIVAFVMSIVTGAISSSSASSDMEESSVSGYDDLGSAIIALTVFAVIAIVAIIVFIAKIFVGNALLVGGSRFFVMNQTEDAKPGILLYGFKSGSFGNIVLVMFLRDLFIGLWTLLFIVPGIIKNYEYLMVPYILAENPQMSRKDAFAISKRMMMGQKWNAFVLDLSFFGWRLLEGITLGIAGIFYVEPYYQATLAELYTTNRAIAYQNGYIR